MMSSDQNKIGLRAQKYSKAKSKTDLSTNTNKSASKNKKTKQKRSLLFYSAIALVLFILGSMLGYGIIGGRNAFEVFDINTWLHMYNLIFG